MVLSGVCSVDQFIYAVGGYDGTSQLSSMERYDVGSDQWTAITPMNCPRSALSVSVVDSRIYAIGKCSVAGHFVLARYLSVLLYMLHTHTHTRLTALFPGLPR